MQICMELSVYCIYIYYKIRNQINKYGINKIKSLKAAQSQFNIENITDAETKNHFYFYYNFCRYNNYDY